MKIYIKIILFFLMVDVLYIENYFAQNDSIITSEREWEIFPILNYDTDVGFGYGAKGFFYNFLNHKESFDLTIYNSTKGERWYQLIYSIPDKQRRHGKQFGFAFDFTLDYDKWTNSEFYSDAMGNEKEFSKEKYTLEPIELKAIFSGAFSKEIISELGFKYSSISCYNFDSQSYLNSLALSNTQHASIVLNLKYDSRIEIINPSSGILIELKNEYAIDIINEKQSHFKNSLNIQSYFEIFYSKIILASRLILANMSDVSFPNKLVLGGNNTIRGLPQSRYFSDSYILINQEVRFPLFWKFGGIVGLDIGNSESTPEWIINTIVGLRFYMDNFIVRADLGFGKETSGFYFNFGHLF